MKWQTKTAKINLYLKGAGLFVGMLFGAGVFALPYSILQAGVFWGAVYFIIALFLTIVSHLLYGEITFLTEGTHRFTGYARIHLGRFAKILALLSVLFGYYGTLLIYGLLG